MAVCLLATGVTVGLLVSFGIDNVTDLLLDLMPAVPYIVLSALAWRMRLSRKATMAVLAGSIAIAVYGVYNFFDVFVLSTKHNSTEGLVVLFIPVYQMPWVLLTGAFAYLFKRFGPTPP